MKGKVIKTSTLPPERAKRIVMPWIVEFPSGYVLGCSDEATARFWLSASKPVRRVTKR